jgi:hypothetical protein
MGDDMELLDEAGEVGEIAGLIGGGGTLKEFLAITRGPCGGGGAAYPPQYWGGLGRIIIPPPPPLCCCGGSGGGGRLNKGGCGG